jgi:hypothetical protein
MRRGKKPVYNISQDRIESLEEIGLDWKFNVFEQKILEQRCRDLDAFKSEFGHCNVLMRILYLGCGALQ